MSKENVSHTISLYQPPPDPVIEMSMRWTAARMITELPPLAGKLDEFCDNKAEVIDSAVLDRPWSCGQRKLIEIALSLAGGHKIALSDVLDGLGDRYSKSVLDVLGIAMSTITIEVLPDDNGSGSSHTFIRNRQ